jgi:exonuclease VII small subunit
MKGVIYLERLNYIKKIYNNKEWFEGYHLDTQDVDWLIEQVEKVDELEKRNDFLETANCRLHTELSQFNRTELLVRVDEMEQDLKEAQELIKKLYNRKTMRNSDVFDINGNEIFEGDTIRYYWGNEVTGKKYEDVVFFEKGSFYAGSFKKLAVADQVEIIKRDKNV